jgi:RNA polymerase sigma factor (sigma-70 family)
MKASIKEQKDLLVAFGGKEYADHRITLIIDALPNRQQLILQSYYDGVTLKEIGVKLGISKSTVSTLKLKAESVVLLHLQEVVNCANCRNRCKDALC